MRPGYPIFFTNAPAMTAYPTVFGWMSGPSGGGESIHDQLSSKNTFRGRFTIGTIVKSWMRYAPATFATGTANAAYAPCRMLLRPVVTCKEAMANCCPAVPNVH